MEGRLDDVIVRGGENISPGEIEDVLLAHDAVRRCRRARRARRGVGRGDLRRRRGARGFGRRAPTIFNAWVVCTPALLASARPRSSSATSCRTTTPASSCAGPCARASPGSRHGGLGLAAGRRPAARRRIDGRLAEAIGFDGVHVPETIHDSFLVVAARRDGHERVLIRTSVALAFPRSSMTTAIAAGICRTSSDGRFQLGIGTQVRGNIEGRFAVPWTDPIGKIGDYVDSPHAIFAALHDRRRAAPRRALTTGSPGCSRTFNPGPVVGRCAADLAGWRRPEDVGARRRPRRRRRDPSDEQRPDVPARRVPTGDAPGRRRRPRAGHRQGGRRHLDDHRP